MSLIPFKKIDPKAERKPLRRCCGTCRYWGAKEDPPYCLWPQPDLPFWASLDNGDHGDYTTADDGQQCRVWEKAT